MKPLLLFTILLYSIFSFGQKSSLIEQLPSFIPQGYNIKDTAFGDLNNDSKMDVIMVIYSTKEDDPNFRDTAFNQQRPLLLLLQQPNGKLALAKRNDNMIMCKQCGGAMGDPFASITIKNNCFMLEFYGGSSWRWGSSYSFSWNAPKKTWQLIKEAHIAQSGDQAATIKNVTVPSAEVADFNIDNFNINNLYLENVKGKIING